MSDHEFENYLTLIGRLLRLSSAQRTAIGEELRDHFESRLAELTGRGISHENAVRLALEEFGDAAGLAAQFCTIAQTRKRRLIMRCTVASVAALAAAVLVAISLWPDNRGMPVIGQVAAQAVRAEKEVDKAPTIPSQDTRTAETLTKLNEFIDVDLVEGMSLQDAVQFIKDRLGVQILFEKAALAEAAVDPAATSVAVINLRDVRGKVLLDFMLRQCNMGFMIEDGIIFVAPRDWLDSRLIVRVYDCREILEADPAAGGGWGGGLPKTKPAAIEPTESRADDSSDATLNHRQSQLRFVQLSSRTPAKKPANTPAEKLIDVIRNTVAQPTWDEQGGPGTISEYNGLLVVSQTEEVHRQVADLLEQIAGKLAAKGEK